jgi:hypothetical protein
MVRFPSQEEVEDGVPHKRCKEFSVAQAAPIESRPPAPVPQPSPGYGREERPECDTDNEADLIRVAVRFWGHPLSLNLLGTAARIFLPKSF